MPTDINQRAKLLVDWSTGEADPEPERPKQPEAVELGRLGGLKGGPKRSQRLTPERRREIAQKAARARWGQPE